MSVVKDIYIGCDWCNNVSAEGGQAPADSVGLARLFAREAGFHRVAGKDVCAECWGDRVTGGSR
jgi:hypothetical protein